jgi:glutamate formiminotransferase
LGTQVARLPEAPEGRAPKWLECVANVSEGRDASVLSALAEACGPTLADLHSDPGHNRSVFTLVGERAAVEGAARALAKAVVASVDIRAHCGAHPRFGSIDVVPFVALEGWPLRDVAGATSPGGLARVARDSFAEWAASELGLPVFLYGPGRSLPEVRRRAWRDLGPDCGPGSAHPTAGSVAAGCRPVMVAYNLWMAEAGLAEARTIAVTLRSPEVRALAFELPGGVQVSCNLVAPFLVGPGAVWDQVAALARIARGELVGLAPRAVLEAVASERWGELGLSPERTIESRLSQLRGAAEP